uniref:Uncharacterized protein n=1 Tax=Guillardia theta TaxID=55529 RepID=A0A7S4NQD3_GUITH|mmetsp:Transcript_28150/g.91254  ORF Transcript_28150/g.91254 Transcript_28150/m.91254 type:complete len:373 (+) Transcript_28150:286-1404(+)
MMTLRIGGVGMARILGSSLILFTMLQSLVLIAHAREVADLNIPRGYTATDPTLRKAITAYRQARDLDEQLKKSERSVQAQTRELRDELKRSHPTSAQRNSKAYKQEVKMDEDLLNEAERETRKDKRLVRQSEAEMRTDKSFLEAAYSKDVKRYGPSRSDCPSMSCHQAKMLGRSPAACTSYSDCPRINCFDYQESGVCSRGRICARPHRQSEGCFVKERVHHWSRKKCPGMHCLHAKKWGYLPQFCTVTVDEGVCPSIRCHVYKQETSCQGSVDQGYSQGLVCQRPQGADTTCLKANAVGKYVRSRDAQVNTAGSISEWSTPKYVENRMGILILLLFLSCSAAGAFILFRRNARKLAKGKRPPPVPSYFGRL